MQNFREALAALFKITKPSLFMCESFYVRSFATRLTQQVCLGSRLVRTEGS